MECAVRESKGNNLHKGYYAGACRIVQTYLCMAMRTPSANILACLGLDPLAGDATITMLSLKQKLLETMVDIHKTYLVAPYSKQFLRDRALADYFFFVLANDWNAPDLAPWDYNFTGTRCDWRGHDEGYFTGTLVPLLRARIYEVITKRKRVRLDTRCYWHC